MLIASENQRYFSLGKESHFILADTCWSAFTHPSEEEWAEYLDYRRAQGFNAIQLNILQQCHSCLPSQWRHPFAVTAEGGYDYTRINEAYFDRACRLMDMLQERGMLGLLVLVWGNYAPDSMQERNMRRLCTGHVERKPYIHAMTMDEMRSYVTYAVKKFRKYRPVFLVSGDINLNEGRQVHARGSAGTTVYGDSTPRLNAFYLEAMRLTKQLAPECPATYHICPQMTLPRQLLEEGTPDLYMYQPGHNIGYEEQCFNRTLAKELLTYTPKRPVFNSETCYEGNMAFERPVLRFNERHVRHAFWQGVLSGATCGFTYGAAGVWLWRDGGRPCSFPGHVGKVNDWRTDLKLRGAQEVCYGRNLIEKYGLYDTEPAPLLLDNPAEEFVCCSRDDKSVIAVYMSFSYPVRLDWDLSGYRVMGIDLETKTVFSPQITIEDGVSAIAQAPYNYDILLIAEKEDAKERSMP